ncbi:MAG: VWA domain-containing protein, partial [Bacteroidota bacterium]|nr:VWA domain-containing protein [Bacteroidota bacterium]
MSISFNTSLLLIALCAFIAIAFSAYIYRRTVPPVSNGKRYTLVTLRSLSLLCAFLALFEPLLQLTSTNQQKPAIAVLVDNSLSMSQTDKTGNREAVVRKILKSSDFAKLSSQSSLQLYKFSHAASPLSPDSLIVDGGSTDISSAVETAEKYSASSLQGIILITDGNYNSGSNPLYNAERSKIPIFAVGIGDTTDQKDIAVTKLSINSIGYTGTAIPVDATVKATGIDNTTVAVTLLEDGKKIDEKTIHIQSNGSVIVELPVQFMYTAASDGMKKISVRVSKVNGELTELNNVRSSLVKILKNKMNIVVVAGAPSADVSAVMQGLNEDSNIEATLFSQLPTGELRTLTPNATLTNALSKADCLVLVGFPTAQSSSAVIQMITSLAQTKALSIMFIASRTIDPQKVRELESVFPFTIASERLDEQSALPAVASQFKFNSLVQVNAQLFPLFAWEKLPPIFVSLSAFSAKPESQKLLTVKIQGVNINAPLFISRKTVNAKSLALLGYGIFRWKLLASSSDDTKNFFDVWFSSLIRWLTTHDDDALLHVEPSKDFFAQGEPIDFSAQTYNQNFQPV